MWQYERQIGQLEEELQESALNMTARTTAWQSAAAADEREQETLLQKLQEELRGIWDMYHSERDSRLDAEGKVQEVQSTLLEELQRRSDLEETVWKLTEENQIHLKNSAELDAWRNSLLRDMRYLRQRIATALEVNSSVNQSPLRAASPGRYHNLWNAMHQLGSGIDALMAVRRDFSATPSKYLSSPDNKESQQEHHQPSFRVESSYSTIGDKYSPILRSATNL